MERLVIVSGGAQGIGKCIVEHLLSAGYRVSVLDSDREAIGEVEHEFAERIRPNFNVWFQVGDVSKEEDVSVFVQSTIDRFGGIYGLVNNAGISRNKPLSELTLEDWYAVLGVNLTGAFLLSKYTAPYIADSQGAIVNICSTRALMSEPNTEAYSASKGGLLALTHALAISLSPKIRVNAISPGWIEVSAYRKSSARKRVSLSEQDHSQHPAGRVGEAADIARMVLFLLDPANSFITGQNFVIDGGMTKKMIYV
ncbi:MAG: SDR family oxidoreductase [Spirochaetes bacterium]|nr:SDR family oxidoreductase [Spirochaetota bacterium]